MAFTFLHAPLLSSALTLTLTGPVILPTVAPPRVIASYLAPLSFLGVVRSRLLLPDLVLRAEYRALADTIAELLWLRWLLADMDAPQTTSSLYCDNRSAIQIAHNDVFHERTKHIEIDCHFIRHHLQQGTLPLRSVSYEDQLVDIFTKSHPPSRLCDLISKLKFTSSYQV